MTSRVWATMGVDTTEPHPQIAGHARRPPPQQVPQPRGVDAALDALLPGLGHDIRAVATRRPQRRPPHPEPELRRSDVFDVLSTEEGVDGTDGSFIDQADAGVGSGSGPGSGSGAPTAAVPVNLQQLLTSWAPGASRYGFQLKFRCGSSSGAVADLQAQSARLNWRERVTYSRNDFAHRISPSNPTILPPGAGVSFAPARTTVVSPNELEFKGVTDTHWMPTSAVRSADFVPSGTHTLPAIMTSSQVYQYSPDSGTTWTTFAGPFTLNRTLDREVGPPLPGQTMPLLFQTEKAGIHRTTERYKP